MRKNAWQGNIEQQTVNFGFAQVALVHTPTPVVLPAFAQISIPARKPARSAKTCWAK